jgi:hypothetical protein
MLVLGCTIFLQRARELNAALAAAPTVFDCGSFAEKPKAFTWVKLTDCPAVAPIGILLFEGPLGTVVEGYVTKREGALVFQSGQVPERFSILATSAAGFLLLVWTFVPWARKYLLLRQLSGRNNST